MSARTVAYAAGGVDFEGYFAAPGDGLLRAGVLVVPEAPGLGPHVKRRVDALALAGYAALGVDLHGGGVVAASPEEARAWVGGLKARPEQLIARLDAALEALADQPGVDRERLAAAGYCFGGWCALELARAGRPLRSVSLFHASLASVRGAGEIGASLLVCTGDSDPFVPMEQVVAFQAEMRDAGVEYELCLYSGVRHGFTDDAHGSDGAFGYSAKADVRSWDAFMRELNDAVGEPSRS